MKSKAFQLPPKSSLRKELLKVFITMVLIWLSQSLFAQSVGVNTNNPDPSASLEVAGTNKGLLIPRISLQSLTDKATIPNPATALLIYNTNAGLGKAGFYYNSGTPANPAWSVLGAGSATLTLPFSQLGTNSGPLFIINNNDVNSGSIAISGLAANAIGIRGATLSGTGIVGHTSSGGKGITASAANVNGTALEVNGRMQIHGPGQTVGAGKVLTSDANGFATWENAGGDVAFAVSGIKGGGSENLPQFTSFKVPFATEEYDLGGNYSDVNAVDHSTFVAPWTGVYHFSVGLSFIKALETFGATVQLVRTRSNISTVIFEHSGSFLGSGALSYSKDCMALAGDQIHVEVITIADGVSLFVQPKASYFSGHLVIKQ